MQPANGNGMEGRLLLTLALPASCSCHICFPHSWQLKNPTPFCSFSRLHRSSDTSSSTTITRCFKGVLYAPNARSQRLAFSFNGNRFDEEEEDGDGDGGGGDIDDDFRSLLNKRKKKRRKRKRQWWTEELEREEKMDDISSGILDQVIDTLWILKVFKSYGWFLPVILLSLLLATGPKAFLMALTVTIGQSALFLAFEKLMGKDKPLPKKKGRIRRKPSAGIGMNFEVEEKLEESLKTGKKKMGNQSSVGSSNGSVNHSGENASSFGGWDELIELDGIGSTQEPAEMAKGPQRTPKQKGKLGRRGRTSESPLVLRLLMAVFPYLSSWKGIL